MSNKGWIAVDLDGTLAHYDHWRGSDHVGAPVELMVARVRNWLDEGRDVRVFTARIADGEPETKRVIQDWCEQHIGQRLEVTNVKDFQMIELWDDRAVQVIPNTGEPVGQSTRGLS